MDKTSIRISSYVGYTHQLARWCSNSMDIAQHLAVEFKISLQQARSIVMLLNDGYAVPFIRHYRPTVANGLSATSLRRFELRLAYLQRLLARQQAASEQIDMQQLGAAELVAAIFATTSNAALADLTLSLRTSRHTTSQLAVAAGLSPLLLALVTQPIDDIEQFAATFVSTDRGIVTSTQALSGAESIWIEQIANQQDVIDTMRAACRTQAILRVEPVDEKLARQKRFFDGRRQFPLFSMSTYPFLTFIRGRRDGLIQLTVEFEQPEALIDRLRPLALGQVDANHAWFEQGVDKLWHNKLAPKFALEFFSEMREQVEMTAITHFAEKLRAMLLQPAAGSLVTLALESHMRGGVRVAVVDQAGELLDHAVIYPFAPENQWQQSVVELAKLVSRHQVALIAIGGGAKASLVDKLCTQLIDTYPDLGVQKKIVSELGASVYAKSDLAEQALSSIAIERRAAVFIARYLQDPLIELPKVNPLAMHQHQRQPEVNQALLSQVFDAVIQDCVTMVGVDVNHASAQQLAYVPGLRKKHIDAILSYRQQHGRVDNLEQLFTYLELDQLSYRQSAGFLRVYGGSEPLDQMMIHPADYDLVKRIAASVGLAVDALLTPTDGLPKIEASDFIDSDHDLVSVSDLLLSLQSAGSDPRPPFQITAFRSDINSLDDLACGMVLQGEVMLVTHFGAFVNIGLAYEGLVHISELNSQYVHDPHQVVKIGEVVAVRVIEVDKARKRVGLSMKMLANRTTTTPPPQVKSTKSSRKRPSNSRRANKQGQTQLKPHDVPVNTAMRDAFAKLKEGLYLT